MRKYLLAISLLIIVNLSHGQVIYVGNANLVAPIPPATTTSVSLNSGSSYEYRGMYDITLKPGFEVIQSSNTNTSKYFWAYIEYYPTDIEYAILDKEFTSSYVPTINGLLYFAYDEKYTTGILNYQIYDYMHNPLITAAVKASVPALNLNRSAVGKNFFQLDINSIPGLSINAEYQRYFTLEVINDKNEKFVLRFKHP